MGTGFIAWRLGLAGSIVPFIFIFDQSLLFMGTPLQIVSSFTRGVVSITVLAIAIEGYFKGNLSIIERVLHFISSIAILIPNNVQANAIGLTIFLTLMLTKLRQRHKLKH